MKTPLFAVIAAIGLAIGITFGLWYGWEKNPVEFVDVSPDTLRQDYQADYYLTVAEAFQYDQNMDKAIERLLLLTNDSLLAYSQEIILYAAQIGYTAEDLLTMRDFSFEIERWVTKQQ